PQTTALPSNLAAHRMVTVVIPDLFRKFANSIRRIYNLLSREVFGIAFCEGNFIVEKVQRLWIRDRDMSANFQKGFGILGGNRQFSLDKRNEDIHFFVLTQVPEPRN